VDRREDDKGRAEVRADDGFPGQPEVPEARGDKERRRDLDCGVAGAERRAAGTTAAAQQEVRDDGDVVVPRDLGRAGSAGRAWADERAPFRQPRGNDVQEAPKGESGRKDD